MSDNYLNKHNETRTRIAKGARRQLYAYLDAHDDASVGSFKLNRILLNTGGKVRQNGLRKAPSIVNNSYSNDTRFSSFVYHSTAERRRNFDDTEFFEDEGIEILTADQSTGKLKRAMITHHAILRAFERGLWMFKDKPVSEWIETFVCLALQARYVGGMKYFNSDFKEHTCVVESDGLNTVVQQAGNASIVILTFTPSTKKEG